MKRILVFVSAILLSAMGTPAMRADSIANLIQKFGDEDMKIAMAATDDLIAMGKKDPAVIDALIKTLEHKDRLFRYNAANALGRINAEKAIPALAKLFKNKQEDQQEGARHDPRFLAVTRSTAASALGLIGPASLPVLTEALKDQDPLMRVAAVGAMSRAARQSSALIPLFIKTALREVEWVNSSL